MISIFDKIIYISCNPETLARDVKKLLFTHDIIKVAAFDQFPYTHHLESGVFLVRKMSKYIDEYRDIRHDDDDDNNHGSINYNTILNNNFKSYVQNVNDQNEDVQYDDDIHNDVVDDDLKVEKSTVCMDDIDYQPAEKKQKIVGFGEDNDSL
jgi:hypothetical protein